jgi:Novel toxin 11
MQEMTHVPQANITKGFTLAASNAKQTRGWKEKESIMGEMTGMSLGMNMAFGGVGNQTDVATFVGPEGAIQDIGKHNTGGQHGHAFFKYDSSTYSENVPDAAGGRLMVGFEGSGPGMASLLGKHGAASAISGNKRSLTGQSKAAALDLPSAKRGGVKAIVDKKNLKELKETFSALEQLKGKKYEKEIMQRLLVSTSQDERDKILEDLRSMAEFYEDDMDLLD